MDLGGGTGALCARLCQQYPNLITCIVELPSVVPFTQEYIDKLEDTVRPRIRVQVGPS